MERDQLEDLDTDSRIMLQEIGLEGTDWILLAIVNKVMIHTIL
jgi:hypothetical protein